MSRSAVTLLVALAVGVVTACAPAEESAPGPTASSLPVPSADPGPSDPPPTSTPEASAPEAPSDPTTTVSGRLTTEATEPPDTSAHAATTAPTPATTSTTTASTTTAGTPTSDPLDVSPDDGGTEGDEPSFDIGESVELDVDLVRFPVDDAGLGGPTSGSPSDGEPGSASGSVTGWEAFDASLRADLLRPGNTAFSVAVSIGGDVVHAAAFGERDPSTGAAADVGDRFRIASISKPITAIVAMQLVADGVIGLDDPVGAIVGEHVGLASVPGSTAGLTLRRLLTHTSGFGKYDSTFFRGASTDCPDAARRGLASGAGGGGYTYSNMNYCVAGLVIEALSGTSYERAVYERLLTPLGISGMRLPPTIDPGPGETQHVTTPGRNYMETLGAAGAWIASPTDLVTIFDALDTSTPGFKPLETQTVLSMVTPAGGVFGQRGYGLGIISYGGGRTGHTGTIESTHAMVLNRGDGVIWALTVAGSIPSESTAIERIVDEAFAAGGFVAG